MTKPVTFPDTTSHCGMDPMTKKVVCGANAFTSIMGSEFNAHKCAPVVRAQVTLTIRVEAIKE